MSSTILTISESGKVAELIRQGISQGRWEGPLPSERRLSEELGVGRAAVRKALDELSREGLVKRSGPRVRTVVRTVTANGAGGGGVGAWMKKSVAVLAPEAIPVDGSQSRAGWLKFVTMGTVESLRSAGLHALTLSVSELTEEDVVKLAEAGPRGFLVPDLGVPVEKLAGWIKVFQSANVPVVAYGGHDAFGDVDRVVSDHEQGSYDLTRALIARGHRRLVQVWPKPWETYWFAARQRGYERAMREAGLGAEATAEFPRLPFFAKDAEGFEYCVKLVVGFLMGLGLEKGCNAALMAATDRDVFFMTAALRRMGLKSGVDAVVAGYDGYAARCIEWQWEDCGPVLSVDKENERLGEVMVGLLEDRIAGRLGQEPAVRQLGQRVLEGSELGPKAWS